MCTNCLPITNSLTFKKTIRIDSQKKGFLLLLSLKMIDGQFTRDGCWDIKAQSNMGSVYTGNFSTLVDGAKFCKVNLSVFFSFVKILYMK